MYRLADKIAFIWKRTTDLTYKEVFLDFINALLMSFRDRSFRGVWRWFLSTLQRCLFNGKLTALFAVFLTYVVTTNGEAVGNIIYELINGESISNNSGINTMRNQIRNGTTNPHGCHTVGMLFFVMMHTHDSVNRYLERTVPPFQAALFLFLFDALALSLYSLFLIYMSFCF